MGLQVNNIDVTDINFNNLSVTELQLNGTSVWTKPIPPSPQPDEYTVALYHFNGDLKEEISGITGTIQSGSCTFDAGKFGQAVVPTNSFVTDQLWDGVSHATSFTIDFWWYQPVNYPYSETYKGIFFTDAGSYGAYGFSYIAGNSFGVGANVCCSSSVSLPWSGIQGFTLQGVPHHLALVYDNDERKFYGFIDGHKVAEKNRVGATNYTLKFNRAGGCMVDELRLSNIARWKDDFTPPDSPY